MIMGVYHKEFTIKTHGEGDIIDITDDVQQVAKQSQLQNGIVCIFVPGSTGAIITLEYEPGLLKDIPRALDHIAPKGVDYKHHETWHDDNGHSHVRASLLGPSITIPLQDGVLVHGTWQQIAFIELDTQPRTRKIIVQIVGE
jgi:secondary thiamine-phosphate synthase enzyme